MVSQKEFGDVFIDSSITNIISVPKKDDLNKDRNYRGMSLQSLLDWSTACYLIVSNLY